MRKVLVLFLMSCLMAPQAFGAQCEELITAIRRVESLGSEALAPSTARALDTLATAPAKLDALSLLVEGEAERTRLHEARAALSAALADAASSMLSVNLPESTQNLVFIRVLAAAHVVGNVGMSMLFQTGDQARFATFWDARATLFNLARDLNAASTVDGVRRSGRASAKLAHGLLLSDPGACRHRFDSALEKAFFASR